MMNYSIDILDNYRVDESVMAYGMTYGDYDEIDSISLSADSMSSEKIFLDSGDHMENVLGADTELLKAVLLISLNECGMLAFVKNLYEGMDPLFVVDLVGSIERNYYILEKEREEKILKPVLDITKNFKDEDLQFSREDYMNYSWTFQHSLCRTIADFSILNNSFISIATDISKIIIFERDLPVYKKTILPIDIGGRAGGVKYSTHGILFKFPQDVELKKGVWLYGGDKRNDYNASKAVLNEIKSVRSLMEHKIKRGWDNLELPLMTTVTYLGTILFACSFLPLNENSLVYGTNDAGITYENETKVDNSLAELINDISLLYHFESHPVEDAQGSQHQFVLASDVEVHKVQDTFYMLDFGRFNPPNNPLNPFLELFRAEYLIKMENTISCDVFSGFGKINREEYNNKAQDNIQSYFNSVKDYSKKIMITQFENQNIKEMLHKKGINMRHLGFMKFHITKKLEELESSDTGESSKKYKKLQMDIGVVKKTIQFMLIEMILRSCKSLLQEKLNDVSKNNLIADIYFFQRAVFDFHKATRDDTFWSSTKLRIKLIEKFGQGSLYGNEEGENILLNLSFENQEILHKSIPTYCNYKGGAFLFDIDILPYAKSSVPDLDANYIIRELILSEPKLTDHELFQYFGSMRGKFSNEDLILLATYIFFHAENLSMSRRDIGEWISQYLPYPEDEFHINQVFHRKYMYQFGDLFTVSINNLDPLTYRFLEYFLNNQILTIVLPDKATDSHVQQLTDFKYLKGIKFSSTKKISMECFIKLSELEYLEKLDFSGVKKLSDLSISFIANLTHVKSVNLSSGKRNLNVELKEIGRKSLIEIKQLGRKSLQLTVSKSVKKKERRKSPSLTKMYKEFDKILKAENKTSITNSGLQYFTHLELIEVLDLRQCSVGDDGLEYLRSLHSLKYLNLASNTITNTGLSKLSGLRLEYLNLANNYQISDNGLAELKGMDSLQYLYVGVFVQLMKSSDTMFTRITNEGLVHISGLLLLEELYLGLCQVTDEGISDLLVALPKLESIKAVGCSNVMNKKWYFNSLDNDIWISNHHSKSLRNTDVVIKRKNDDEIYTTDKSSSI